MLCETAQNLKSQLLVWFRRFTNKVCELVCTARGLLIYEAVGNEVAELGWVRFGDFCTEFPGSVGAAKLYMFLAGDDTGMTGTTVFFKLA